MFAALRSASETPLAKRAALLRALSRSYSARLTPLSSKASSSMPSSSPSPQNEDAIGRGYLYPTVTCAGNGAYTPARPHPTRPTTSSNPSCSNYALVKASYHLASNTTLNCGGLSMAPNPFCRQLIKSVVFVFLQFVIAALLFLTCLYLASIILQPLQLVGITQIPPGIAYYDYREQQNRF